MGNNTESYSDIYAMRLQAVQINVKKEGYIIG
jgi:hypothetical protein